MANNWCGGVVAGGRWSPYADSALTDPR